MDVARQQKPWDSRELLEKEYIVNKKSTSAIAKEFGTYPMTIRRALKKHGLPIRDKSAAQKNNLEVNGSPLTGRKRSEDEKIRISMGLQKLWEDMTPEQEAEAREVRRKIGKESWLNKTDKEKKESVKNMRVGNRKKVGLGSKNENLIAEMLSNFGFKVVQRSRDYTPARRFEIDIAIPKEKIALEWDGPNHFHPIYGEEHLQAVRTKDGIKNQFLTGAGWTVIRVRDHSTSSTLAFCRRTADKVIDCIKNGKRNTVHIIDAK